MHPVFNLPDNGTVVGLNRHDVTRALGVIVEADVDAFVVATTLAPLRGIDRIILGDFTFS